MNWNIKASIFISFKKPLWLTFPYRDLFLDVFPLNVCAQSLSWISFYFSVSLCNCSNWKMHIKSLLKRKPCPRGFLLLQGTSGRQSRVPVLNQTGFNSRLFRLQAVICKQLNFGSVYWGVFILEIKYMYLCLKFLRELKELMQGKVFICVFVSLCVHMHIHVHVYTVRNMCMCVYLCVRMKVCAHICM